MTALNKLTALAVKNAAPGMHGDGGGLWLRKREDGGAQWVFRYTLHGTRREMGLGGITHVSLKQAREQAAQWRSKVALGQNPIKLRDAERQVAIRNLHKLKDVALDAFESRKADLKGDGKAGRWFSPLELHILPKLGELPIAEISQSDIRDVLSPIWHAKGETARKAISRLSIVMRHGAALGLDVDLQAVDKARALLGTSRAETKYIPSVPWQDVPDFYRTLDEQTVTHLALRLLILTGLRSKPVRFFRLDQIVDEVWTIPGEIMKGRRGRTPDFSVPLTQEMRKVIELALPFARDGYLFPSLRVGVISDATMSRLMERRGMIERPHGFRDSMRTWLSDVVPEAPHEVKEMMLAQLTRFEGCPILPAKRLLGTSGTPARALVGSCDGGSPQELSLVEAQ